jgi:hypothetical protein
LEALVDFAEEHAGSLPSHYRWWALVRARGHTQAWTTFRSHTAKLEQDGLIRFEDGVIVLTDAYWEYRRDLASAHLPRDPGQSSE